MKTCFMWLVAFFLFGCAAAQTAFDVPLPRDVRVVPPGPDVPKELAGFSGKWSGVIRHNEPALNILIVEEIKPPKVVAIYASSGHFVYPAQWYRVQGQFVEGAIELRLPDGQDVIYRRQPDDTLSLHWRARKSVRGTLSRMKE